MAGQEGRVDGGLVQQVVVLVGPGPRPHQQPAELRPLLGQAELQQGLALLSLHRLVQPVILAQWVTLALAKDTIYMEVLEVVVDDDWDGGDGLI